MIKLLIQVLLLVSLLFATVVMSAVVFSGAATNHTKLMLPGLFWACWLAGVAVKDTYHAEKPFA